MKDVLYNSTSEQLSISLPPQAQSVVTNSQNYPMEPSNNIDSSRDDRSGYDIRFPTVSRGRGDDFVVRIKPDEEGDQRPPPLLSPTTQFPRFYDHHGMLHLLYAGAMPIMTTCAALAQLVQLKFQGNKSPFETHAFLAHTAIVVLIIAVLTSIPSSFYYKSGCLNSPIKERFDMILKSVFYFSSILSPLSFVLVLLIPQRFDWIGYPIIFVLLVTVVGCNFGGYIKSYFRRKMYPTWERTMDKFFSTKDDVSLGAV